MTSMANQNRPKPIRVLDCPVGTEYDEETFRYFLGIEQARAAREGRQLRLLLATLEPTPGQSVPFPRAGAARFFDALRLALRDTDVMGWYRQGQVAAAVLTAPSGSFDVELTSQLERRVGDELRRRVPRTLASALRVRIVHKVVAERGRTRGTA